MNDRHFLKELEQDLYEVIRSIQLQLRSVAGDPQCSACVNASTSSITFNIYRVIRKLRDRMTERSLYQEIRDRITEEQRAYKRGDTDLSEYKLKAAKIRFLISEIEMAARDLDDEEIPDSLCIRVLSKQLSNVAESLKRLPEDKDLNIERELILSFLPEEADDEELDEAIHKYIEENPQAKMGEIIGYVSKNHYCNKAKLALKVKQVLAG